MDRLKGILPRKGPRTCPTKDEEPPDPQVTTITTTRHLKIEHGQENTELVLVPAPSTKTNAVIPIPVNMKPKKKRKNRLMLLRRKPNQQRGNQQRLGVSGSKLKPSRSTVSKATSVFSALGEISEISGNSASVDDDGFSSSEEDSDEDESSCTTSINPGSSMYFLSRQSSRTTVTTTKQSNTMVDSAFLGMYKAFDMTAVAMGLMPIKEERDGETTRYTETAYESSSEEEDVNIPKQISIPYSPTPSSDELSAASRNRSQATVE